jgi:hypothetical protein
MFGPHASLVAQLQAAPTYPTFEIAFRSGLSVPTGDVRSGVPLKDIADLQAPLHLDIGARVARHVFVGGYASVGIGDTSTHYVCPADDCAGRTVHLGAQVHVHILPQHPIDPWLGVGFGYEWFFTSGSPKTSMEGLELVRPMAGFDVRLSPHVALGPFVDGTVAKYSFFESATNATHIDDTRVHSWITLGLRLVLLK